MLYKFIKFAVLIFFFIGTAEAQNIDEVPLKIPDSIITPFPSLVEFANKHDIALNHIEIRDDDSKSEKGNCVNFLITLYRGSSMQQWFTIITQDIVTTEESQLKPLPDETVYTSTGRVFKFKNTKTALNLKLIGPFTASKSNSDKRYIKQLNNPYRVLISQEKLNCDLEIYAERSLVLAKRVEEAGAKERDFFYIGSSNPISENDIEKGKSFIKIVHPTDEEERIGFDFYFALRSFYDAAMAIDEFKEIVYKVINKPSIWSIITNPGISTNINYYFTDVHPFKAGGFGIEFPVYEQPLRLFFNGKIALRASIIMTKPRSPLKACAGIVGLYAEHPIDKDKRLLIQLISANIKS